MTREQSDGIRSKLPEFLAEVRSAKRVLISTHLNPDGDAIGSALTIKHVLDQLNIPNEVLCHNTAPSYLAFLPGADQIHQTPEFNDHDCAVVCDLDALDRLGTIRPYVEALPRLTIIDHHIPHEAPGNIRIVDTASPATCAILCDLFFDSEITITPEIADCLLAGIVTDTGSFKFPNTTPHCLHVSGQLLEFGANLPRLTEEVYMSRALESARLLGEALHSMRLECDNQLAYVVIPFELLQELGARDEHTEGIVNELLSIETVKIAAILRESKPNKFKGSLRSRIDFDVAKVAQEFGGGGHRNAAGLNLEGPREEVEKTIVDALKKCLESC